MLKFVCPNGHQLTAQDHFAGKSAKCPKCNAAVVIPTAEAAAAQLAALEALGVLPEGSSVEIAAASSGKHGGTGILPVGGASVLPVPGEIFIFLCPNGHKLNGPPSLKGKPGQCPHCGARFIIPTDEDVAQLEAEQLRAEQLAAEEDFTHDEFLGGVAGGGEANHGLSGEQGGTHSAGGLASIIARLWQRRTEQTELEIFLNEGEILAPDYFSESLSSRDHGVFAIQEGDGSLAITVIPWSTVRRVVLRRIDQLPSEFFQ